MGYGHLVCLRMNAQVVDYGEFSPSPGASIRTTVVWHQRGRTPDLLTAVFRQVEVSHLCTYF